MTKQYTQDICYQEINFDYFSGQKFAMMELKSVICRILRHYELLPVPNYEPVVLAETIIKSKNGIKLRLKARK